MRNGLGITEADMRYRAGYGHLSMCIVIADDFGLTQVFTRVGQGSGLTCSTWHGRFWGQTDGEM